jgi:hypothetical protein
MINLLSYHKNCFTSMLSSYKRNADCSTCGRSSYRALNTFDLGYKNQSVYDVSGTSRCLFSDNYKTHIVWAERTVVEC